MQPLNDGLFNKNGFHTHGYKNKINNDNGFMWHINLLLMIKKISVEMYYKLIDNPFFINEKEYIESDKEIEIVKELTRYFK